MREGIKKCRFCGKQIGVITWGIYRKVVVDAEAVWVQADPEGEEFVRIDGSKVQAREAGPLEEGEWAYRIHRRNCFSGGET